MFLSIIIPIYNDERFLAECLDSCLDQDFPRDDYEIICVDDGSTDKTPGILKEYADKYSNIRLMMMERHKGGRKVGYLQANGDYIWFVDHDDIIAPNALVDIFNAIRSGSSYDRIAFPYYEFYEELSPDEKRLMQDGKLVANAGNDLAALTLWSGVIRTAFLKAHNILPRSRRVKAAGEFWGIERFKAWGGDNICMEECFRGDMIHFIIKRNLRKELPEDWLAKMRDVCVNVDEPREGKKKYIGQTFRDVTYTVSGEGAGAEEKTVGIRTIYDITERICDHDGQMYLIPKVECDMYSVNVDFADEEVIELYHKHGEMEQYHSEIKTDLGAEQLPSGKFDTNELVLELVQLAYNMLRIIGQASLGLEGIPAKRPVKRRRLRTVVMHVIMTPAVIVTHARKSHVDLGRSNPWRNAAESLWKLFNKKKH